MADIDTGPMTPDNMKISTMDISNPAGWFWFMFISLTFTGLLVVILSFTNIVDISTNWNKNRCNPMIMPFASLFGYNTAENFNFCVGNILKNGASKFTGPFSSILQMFIGSLMTIMSSLNSFRVILATLMGGITKIFTEITERFQILMSNIVLTSSALKRLMGRMFATFYAIIYMGTSGIQAGTNFTNTFLFSFLDTFCFDPSTMIEVADLGPINISQVEIGDILANGQKVTAIYHIMADGQKMVKIGQVTVSSNHYIRDSNKAWIRADEHPDAIEVSPWSGGKDKPLICLDTDTHEIPIGPYIFSDYNEIDSSDTPTMKAVQDRLNNTRDAALPPSDLRYTPSLSSEDKVILKNGSSIKIDHIRLGDELSTGRVYGIVKRNQANMFLYKGTIINGSTLVWVGDKKLWERVYSLPDATELFNSYDTCNLLVLGSAVIETPNLFFRDLMELHDPDIENITIDLLKV
jgi:hypothetical protein